jgi:drug/metabolite transporter (DMT)-like permease
LLFSTKAIWIKLCFKESAINATELLWLRMLMALPFYVFVLMYQFKRQKQLSFSSNHVLWAIIMGIIGYYASSLFDFIGLQYISAGIERVILFIYPTLAVLINHFLFKSPISKRQWTSIGITYIGIAIAYFGEWHLLQYGNHFIYGSIMVLLCAITYAFYLVGSGKLIPSMGASNYTSIAMLAATFGIFIHFFVTEQLSHVTFILYPSSNVIWYIIALAMIATVIPSFLLSQGMKHIGSNDVSIITSIGPVSTLLQAHWFLNEQFGGLQILGTCIVIFGVLYSRKN